MNILFKSETRVLFKQLESIECRDITESRIERLTRTLKSYIGPNNFGKFVTVELNEKIFSPENITNQYDKVRKNFIFGIH